MKARQEICRRARYLLFFNSELMFALANSRVLNSRNVDRLLAQCRLLLVSSSRAGDIRLWVHKRRNLHWRDASRACGACERRKGTM
jgi:hypothetical protein